MSPEQARGKPVDKRADIWAFGVLLHEMLTGRQLFTGDTVSDVLAAVLRQEVDWKALPPAVPAELRRLLGRCLERNPKNRLHDIADARIAIDELLRGADRDEPPLVVAQTPRLSRRLVDRRDLRRARARGAPGLLGGAAARRRRCCDPRCTSSA